MTDEIFPLVDEDGNVIGQATRCKCHDGSMLLHPVIHLHIFNTKGELFLQKRSKTKDIQPDKWDSSVGGHIDLGETALEAACREAKEELGIENITPHFITKYIIETDRERELTYCFLAVYDGVFSIDLNEVVDGRFWTIPEIEEQQGRCVFTYNFECDFNNFLSQGLQGLVDKIK